MVKGILKSETNKGLIIPDYFFLKPDFKSILYK